MDAKDTSSNPIPFLKSIAEVFYREKSQLLYQYRFFFQNKRAGLFFLHYLKEFAQREGRTILLPQVVTLNEYLRSRIHLPEEDVNNKLFVIFEIFRAYQNQFAGSREREQGLDFNNFYTLGELILNDFNDMDKHLVPIDLILKNSEELALLKADPEGYLTEDQLLALKHFSKGVRTASEMKEDGQILRATFNLFWSKLPQLYQDVKQRLTKLGLSYEGMLYRDICDQLDAHEVSLVEDGRVNVFVGLNALTPSERKILMHFKRAPIEPIFYWDYDSVLLSEEHIAGYFKEENLEAFPEPSSDNPLARPEQTAQNYLPKVEVVSIPSSVAQSKVVGDRLKELLEESRHMQVAVVLPNERLLMPFLSNLPSDMEHVNITMGYPIRETPIAGALLRLLQLQKTFYQRSQRWRGEEVVEILSMNPLTQLMDSLLIDKVGSKIKDGKLYYLSWKDIQLEANNHPIIKLLLDLPPKEEYTAEWMLNSFILLLSQLIAVPTHEEVAEDKTELTYSGNAAIYYTLLELLHRQKNSLMLYGHGGGTDEGPFTAQTMSDLLKGILTQARVPFKGEPLRGLQVMGILETRGLDFDYIFIPDAGEGILPSSSKVMGLLPHELRLGYGMPTYYWQDRIRAYNFFRLISRAKRVITSYDSRKGALSVGEPSRYIRLLDYVFGADVQYLSAGYELQPLVETKDMVDTALIEGYMANLSNRDDARVALSPSSLADYLTCPRRFYYTQILQLREQEQLDEIINKKDYGTLVHNSLNKLYAPYKGQWLEASSLEALQGQVHSIVAEVYAEIFKSGEHQGINSIIFSNAEKVVSAVLESDLKLLESCSIQYLDSERRVGYYSDLLGIHFKGFIDRLDYVENKEGEKYIRVIDYKTGKDSSEFKIKDIWDSESNGPSTSGFNRVSTQLLLYCMILEDSDEEYKARPLQPVMYKLDGIEEVVQTFVEASGEVKDYATVKEPFEGKLQEVITALKEDKEFTPCPGLFTCAYCPARFICGAAIKNNHN